MQTNYVLITAARNEEDYIEKTIRSVISQTLLPKKWIIVSDGSTDRTDDIVKKYMEKFDFITLIRVIGGSKRDFNSKVFAITTGYQTLKGQDYCFIGILDADISFGPSYYEEILKKFAANQKLGIAGGKRFDRYKSKFVKVNCDPNSVGGPFQFFRRKCFEDIGGMTPLKKGSEDAVAEIMARMLGWEVRSFDNLHIKHYRLTASSSSNVFMGRFNYGIAHYVIGYHPLFYTLRALYHSFKSKPYVISAFATYSGYCWAFLLRYERPMPENFMTYFRSEQFARLRSMLKINMTK